MKQLTQSCKVRALAWHLAAAVQDELVVLHRDEGAYYGLNPTGARIWNLVADFRPVNEIVDILLDEFDSSREVVELDVLRVLTELHQHGLIEVEES